MNEGDIAAAAVQVTVDLTVDGAVTDGEKVIDFLGGAETVDLVCAFDDHPADGELEIRVSGFSIP